MLAVQISEPSMVWICFRRCCLYNRLNVCGYRL